MTSYSIYGLPLSDQGAQIKSCTEVKVEHEAEDEESGGVIEVPSSPTYSDVSVSR